MEKHCEMWSGCPCGVVHLTLTLVKSHSQTGMLSFNLAITYMDKLYITWNWNVCFNYMIVKCNGMKNNSIVATYSENLWFGTLSFADHSQIKLRDQDDVDGSDNVNFIAKFTAGVQYGFGGDIVYHSYTA